MAAPAGHLKTHWKKYVFGTLAYGVAVRYFTKKYRDNNVIREYCNEARKYGERRTTSVMEKPRKIYVFLNPRANKIEAKSQFMKYAAPLFHLSGTDVTIVESEYEGQIRTLLGYVDPKTDAIVVAGGDGTLLEVVNGLMRRYDIDKTRSIPIGIIPLGRENKFYHSTLLNTSYSSPARHISEAAMNVIRGSTVPMHLVEIEPESGRKLYAVSSIEWGAFKEAVENRDNFRLFGKLRLFLSYVSTAVKKWPNDYLLHVWMPGTSLSASQPPPSDTPSTTASVVQNTHSPVAPSNKSMAERTSSELPSFNVAHSSSPSSSSCNQRDFSSTEACGYPKCIQATKKSFRFLYPTYAHCASMNFESQKRVTTTTTLSQKVPSWMHEKFNVVGFKVMLLQQHSHGGALKLTVWPSTMSKMSFVKHGWAETMKRLDSSPFQSLQSSEFILQPVHTEEASWVSVDGEPYEAVPIAVRVLPNALSIFSSGPSNNVIV